MKKSMKKLIVIMIATITILGTFIVGVNAEWKHDSNGWWNTEGSSYSIGWKQIDGKWYYFDVITGYMKTGWIQDNSKWYYLNNDGSMASSTIINGYVIDSTGVWINTTQGISTVNNTNNVINDKSTTTNNTSSSSPAIDNDYMTIFYDTKYNIKGTTSGADSNTTGEYDSNGNVVTFQILHIKLSDYNLTKEEFQKQIFKSYKLQNDNGTVKLVKKSVTNNTNQITK